MSSGTKIHRNKVTETKHPQEQNILRKRPRNKMSFCDIFYVRFTTYNVQCTVYNEQKTLLYKGGYKFIMVEHR
jgi:hypothetical protein